MQSIVKAVLVLSLTALCLQGQAVLTLTGNQTSVAVSVSGDPISGIQFEALLGSSVTIGTGAVAASKQIQCADVSQPPQMATNHRCLVFGLNANVTTGELAVVNYPQGATYPLTLTGVTAVSPDGMTLGTVAVPIPHDARCDLNQDNALDLNDVLLSVAGALTQSPCTPANDFDANGVCDILDVHILVLATINGKACEAIL